MATINGGTGDDTLNGTTGADQISGAAGNDALRGGDGDDVLDGGTGNDYMDGSYGADTYVVRLGSGQDRIDDWDPTAGRIDTVRFEDVPSTGLVAVRASGYNLVLEYGNGDSFTIQNHFINGHYAVERFQFSDGVTWTAEQLYAAYPIQGSTGGDYPQLSNQAETVATGAGDDRVHTYGGNDTVDAGAGNDYVEAGTGDDTVSGGAGNDTLHGQDGNDVLDGGAGDDRAQGGTGDDSVNGGDGADSLYGEEGNDVLDGGAGNDYLAGSYGADTYVVRTGSGQDRMEDWDNVAGRLDTLKLEDVPSTGLTALKVSGSNLVLEYGNGDSFTIENHFINGGQYAVEQFQFSDGVTLTAEQLYAAYPLQGGAGADTARLGGQAETIAMGAGDDRVYSFGGSDTVDGGAGHDYVEAGTGDDTVGGGDGHDGVYGQEGNDVLDGGAGDDRVQGGTGDDRVGGGDGADTLYGEDGADIMDGGAGNDYMDGSYGADTYVVRVGSGQDRIDDWDPTAGRIDTVKFEDVPSTGLAGVRVSGYHLVLEYGNGDTFTVQNHFLSTSYSVERFQFSDGVTWTPEQLYAAYPVQGTTANDYVVLGNQAETVAAGAGDDRVYTYGGNDTVDAGAGDDYVEAGAGDDTVSGGAGNDGVYGQEGNDVLDGGAGNDRVQGGTGDDRMTGGEGGDTMYGEEGADVIDGGAGNDHMEGSYGADIYVVRQGSGHDRIDDWDNVANRPDTIRFEDVPSTGITAVRVSGYSMIVEYGDGNSVTVLNQFQNSNYLIEQFQFSDGVTWTAEQLYAAYPIQGSEGNDVARLGNLADTLSTGVGEDTVYTFGGNDTVDAGTGNDHVEAGAGDDTVSGGTGQDAVYGQEGNDVLDGGAGNDRVQGGTGDDRMTGGDGGDTLYGEDGADVLDGGAGNDYMDGSYGADTYVLRAGSGHDRIDDWDNVAGRIDTLKFEDVPSTGITGIRTVGMHLVLDYGNGDSVTLQNHFHGANYQIDRFQFSDGVTWTQAQLFAAYPVSMTEGNDTGMGFTDAAETIHALAGHDSFATLGGDDVVDAGSGNDTVDAGAGNDRVLGGDGADTVYGRDGDDQVEGGAGNDTLYGEAGADVLDGGTGNDFMQGGAGADTFRVRAGSGHDTIDPYSFQNGRVDTVKFEDVPSTGITAVRTVGRSLVVEYGSGDSVTLRDHFNGADYQVKNFQFSDGVTWTQEQLFAAYPVLASDGNDDLGFTDGAEAIQGGAGHDTLRTWGGDDVVDAGSGNDTVDAGTGNDRVLGGDGADTLYGREGDDQVEGGTGADSLYGDAGADLLDGGAGNDFMHGGAGTDTYLVRTGSGHDTIEAYNHQTGRVDTLKFEDVASTGITAVRTLGRSLIVEYGNGDSVTLRDHFWGADYQVKNFQFSDGVTWTQEQLFAAYPVLASDGNDDLGFTDGAETILGGSGHDTLRTYGGADTVDAGGGNDRVYAGTGNDVVDGGAGDDTMEGGAGDDTFVLRIGSGRDTIDAYDTDAGRVDTIVFEDVASNELTAVMREGYNLVFEYGSGDRITVQNHFYGAYHQISSIQFSDGVVWSAEHLAYSGMLDLYSLDFVPGETISGGTGVDMLQGTDGDDQLYARAGNDRLEGFGGGDALYGEDGNDVLEGGTGDDYMDGGLGNDTWVVRQGDGRDTIRAYDYQAGRVDTLKFDDVPSTGITALRTIGYDLVVEYGAGDAVTLQNYFHGADYGVTRVQFSDGVTWSMAQLFAAYTVQGSDGNDDLRFTEGADRVAAGGGDDNVYGFGGNDVLDGGTGNDTVQGGTGNDTVLGGAGNDALHGEAGDDTLRGGTGADSLHASDGNDVLDGGAGDDYMDGSFGNDTWVVRKGDGRDSIRAYDYQAGRVDTLKFEDVASTGITAIRTIGYDLVVEYGAGDAVTIQGFFHGADYQVTRVQFADGVTWNMAELFAAYPVLGSDGNDDLRFTEGADRVAAGGGDDTLYGFGGGDQLDGGTGNDTAYGGAGNDALLGGTGNDALHGEAGDDTLRGGAGADGLYGSDGNDVLEGGTGDDHMDGGFGSDTFTVRKGDGRDSIRAYDYQAGRVDTLKFEDVASTGITAIRTIGYDLVVEYGAGDAVTIQGFFQSADYQVSRVQFSDGVSWNMAELFAAYPVAGSDGNDDLRFTEAGDRVAAGGGDDTVYGMGGDDHLDGGTGNDNLQGGAGGDTLLGAAGNDTLSGEAGDDTLRGGTGGDGLYGSDGADVLDGGAGDDYLDGGFGSDTWVLRDGSGHDTIRAYDYQAGRVDTVKFEDVPSTGITAVRSSGYALVIEYGAGNSVTLNDFFHGADYQANRFEFSDGVTWTQSQLLAAYPVTLTDGHDNLRFLDEGERIYAGQGNDAVSALGGDDQVWGESGNDALYGGLGNDTLSGGDGTDTLSGETGDDTLLGGAGNDTLTGADGADVLDGGTGDDYLDGGFGSDTFVVRQGDGRDTIRAYDWSAGRVDTLRFEDVASTAITAVRSSGYDLVVEYGTGDSVTLQNFFHGTDYQVSRFQFSDGVTWTQTEFLAAYPVTLTDGDDNLRFLEGGERVYGGAGNDVITALGGDDRVWGEGGADTLYGGAGNDALDGGTGADWLAGEEGNDVLDGGTGDDSLTGGAGSDTYVFRQGSGVDLIRATYDPTAGRTETVRFEDVASTGLTAVRRSGDNLVLEYGSGDRVTIDNQFSGAAYAIDRFTFSDGVTWSWAQLYEAYPIQLSAGSDAHGFTEAAETVLAGAGDDSVSGNGGDDRLYGEAGNDSLSGGTGADQLFGGEGNDSLGGDTGADVLDGGTGNDSLTGGEGSDTFVVRVGSGQDLVRATYDPSAGRVDTLKFEDVASTGLTAVRRSGDYLVLEFGTADSVTIENHYSGSAYGVTRFQFSDGVTWTPAQLYEAYSIHLTAGSDSLTFTDAAETVLAGTGDDSVSGLGGDDRLYGEGGHDALYGNAGADRLFGGEGSDTLRGGDGTDVLDGGAGNDTLEGDAGNDTYLLRTGSGHDTVQNYDPAAGRVDTLKFEDVASTGLTAVRRSGDHLVLEYGAGDSVTLQHHFNSANYSVNQIQFADGVTWTPAQLYGAYPIQLSAGNDSYGFTDSAETIHAGAGDDSVSSYGGDDFLYGQAGNDSLYAGTGADLLSGDDGNDYLRGGDGADVLDGGAGNDTLDGETGNDTYLVRTGSGHDLIQGYDPTAGRVDTLKFEDVASTGLTAVRRSGENLVLEYGSGDSVTVQNHFYSANYAISQIQFSDGITLTPAELYTAYPIQLSAGNDSYGFGNTAETIHAGAGDDTVYTYGGDDRLEGQAGNDYLRGGDGADVLDGGVGNDTVDGDAGNDTYLVRTGSGHDLVQTYDTSAGRVDTLKFEDVPSTGLTAVRRSGENLVLEYGSGDSVTVQNHFYSSNYAITQIQFSDGITLTPVQLYTAYPIQLSAGNDSYGFGNTAETIQAGAGDDTVYTYGGDDRLEGQAGNDYLRGGDGADVLDGGVGNDTLDGDAGNDTYLLRTGSGQDLVQTYDTGAGRVDTLKFEDVASTGLTSVRRSGENLVLEYGTGDRVTVQNHFYSANYAISQIQFSDGVTWTPAELMAAYPAPAVTSLSTAESPMLAVSADDAGTLDESSEIRQIHRLARGGEGPAADAAGPRWQVPTSRPWSTGTLPADVHVTVAGSGLGAAAGTGAPPAGASVGDTRMAEIAAAMARLGASKNDVQGQAEKLATAMRGLTEAQGTVAAAAEPSLDGVAEALKGQMAVSDGWSGTPADRQVEALVNAMAIFSPPAAADTALPENYHESLSAMIAASLK